MTTTTAGDTSLLSLRGMPVRVALLWLLVLLAYGRAPWAELVFDDPLAVAENPVINGQVPLGEAFTRDFWGQQAGRIMTYRPVPVLLSGIAWRLSDGSTVALHALPVLLHAVLVAAMYLVWRRLSQESIAFAAAALMAVLAAPSEAVFTVVGQADVLAALFATVGLWLHRTGGTAALCGSLLVFALALGAKETGVVSAVMWLAMDWLVPVEGRRRIAWERAAGYAVVLAGYFMLRTQALDGLRPVVGDMSNPLIGAPFLARVLGAGHVFLTKYLAEIVNPVEWQYECSYAACLPGDPSDPIAWLGVLVAVALAVGAVLLARRTPIAGVMLGWFVLFFLPVSNFVVMSPTVYGGRLMYQPVIGLCLAGAFLVHWLASRARRPALVWGVWATVIVGNLMAMQVRASEWQTEETLYTSGLQRASNSAVVRMRLATWHSLKGNPAEAVVHAREAVAIAPDYAVGQEALAVALDLSDQPDEADKAFQRVLQLDPSKARHLTYATFLARRGALSRALEVALAGRRAAGPEVPQLDGLVAQLQADLASAKE